MSATTVATAPAVSAESRLPGWWPLAGLVILAAALRFSTLDVQGLWYDEAFTPVHVLHRSLRATLRAMADTENTPPLWYVLVWGTSRVLGTGAVALRLLSALAGVATVPVAWAIGRELSGRRAAIAAAALVCVNPLFVWYSQEARAYSLFVLASAIAMLCFLRARREPTAGRLTAFAVSGSLALLTHYFAVFLLIPMIALLLAGVTPRGRRERGDVDARGRAPRGMTMIAVGAIGAVGVALLPLAFAQGGHGSQWIGRWALVERLEAIPQYFLTGYSGAPLGHGIELLVALPIMLGVGLGLRRGLQAGERQGALIAMALAACGILLPILLVAVGADYLAPRNLVAAMIPLTGAIAVLVTARRTGPAGPALAGTIVLAFLAVSIDVDLSPRLQRGNWRDVARVLGGRASDLAVTTVELGAAPLEYYRTSLHNLPRSAWVTVAEIDETGYAPLRPTAGRPPAPGFRLIERLDVDGLIVYRFVSSVPRTVSEAMLRRHVITLAHPEVLVPAHAQVSFQAALASRRGAQLSSSSKKI